MKKLVTVLATAVLGTMLSTTIFAAENPDVWDTQKRVDDTLKVSVETNGKATDGMTTILYDAKAFTVKEADVKVSDSVDVYSVNVEEESVKIAYVAKDAMEKGVFITVDFGVTESYAEKEVSVEVETVAHDADGKTLVDGEAPAEPETEKPETEQPEKPGTEAPGTEAPDTEETGSNSGNTGNAGGSGSQNVTGEIVLDQNQNTEEAWNEAGEKLASVPENGVLVVKAGKQKKISKAFLEELKGQNKTVQIVLDNGIKISINGTSITGKAKDVNLNAVLNSNNIPQQVTEQLTQGRDYVELSLEHEGKFGFTAVITVPVEKENAGKYANLYYYNKKNGKMEFVASGLIGADGNVDLSLTHASDYIIVIDNVAVKGSAKTNDTANFAPAILLLFGGVLVMAGALRKRKVY